MEESKRIDLLIESVLNNSKDLTNEDNEEVIERLKSSITKIKSFSTTILVHLIIGMLIIITLSTILSFVYHSKKLFFILLFITLPILIGIGIFGIGRASSNFISGINYIIEYLLELINLYYKEKLKENNKEVPSISIVMQLLFSKFILPVLKNVTNKLFFGKIITYSIFKAIKWLSIKIQKDTQVVSSPEIQIITSEKRSEEIQEILLRVEKVKDHSTEKLNKYLKKFKIFINIISVLCVIIGVPINAFIVFFILKLMKNIP